MKERKDMTFPMSEYKRRLSELRKKMAERLLDAVIITDPANIMYLTDYQTTGYSYFQAIIVSMDDEPLMITRLLEESNVIARTWVERTLPYNDTGDAIETLVNSLRDTGLYHKRIAIERNSYFFPAYQQARLQEALHDGKYIYDCYGIVEELRMCKSDAEVKVLKKAAKATEAGMKAGIQAAIPGVTENEIAAEISAAMFKAGGEFPAVMPYVTTGPRTMIGHATWEGRKLEKGEHAFLEVGGCYRRYHTAMMRTVCTENLSDKMHHAQEILKYALSQVHENFRPGVTIAEAHNVVRDAVMSNEIGATLITRAGYSIGIAFPPSWDEGSIMSLKPDDYRPLKPGMVFHVIPWLWGIDNEKTVGTSDTILITEKGVESFFTMDRDFSVNAGGGS